MIFKAKHLRSCSFLPKEKGESLTESLSHGVNYQRNFFLKVAANIECFSLLILERIVSVEA